MASGGPPYDDYKAKNFDYKSKSNRKPPRYGTSFDAELSLQSELQRSENEERRSLPNNLSWTGGESSRGKKHSKTRGSPSDQFSSDSSPSRFTQKKHTPATLPKTRFSSSATGSAQHRAMDKLKQHLTFTGEDEGQHDEEQQSRQAPAGNIPVNNERNLYQQSSSLRGTPLRNGSGVNSLQLANATNSSNQPPDPSRVLNKLKQVRGYLRQATSLYITLSSKSTSPDEATDEDLEQLEKLANLIRNLKAQEKAYVDFVQRSIADHGQSSIDNTPSTSAVSLDGETQDDAPSEQSEDLEGLRQQHALLRQMVEQQKQLKELQDRQNALLDLQRRAETQLKEAEAEGRRISSLMNGHAIENGSVNGRSRSGTERSEDPRSPQPGAVGGAVNLRGLTTTGLRNPSREQVQPNKKPSNEQKPENFKNRRLPTEQAGWVAESTGSLTPDNEAQALATADAAQERLELESKLMDLQAKKEQMDALVEQLQHLREMQLGKETSLSQERNVNETSENREDEVPLATRSAKDTGDNVDDEKILEALQLHRKLRKLQDVRDKLERLKDLFEEQQEQSEAESDTRTGENGTEPAQQARASQGAESHPSSAYPDDGGMPDDIPPGSIDWILNSGIDDPELLAKLRQVKAAKERVANLKQRNDQNSVAQPYGRAEAAARLAQATVDQDEDSTVQTDNETTGSVSSSLKWQDDPEFQQKLRKLNAARKKLKKLQELVSKTEELPIGPNGRPYLPAEIEELNFSTDEDEEGEDDSTVAEGAAGGQEAAKNESDEEETSETLVQDEATHAHGQLQDDGLGDGALEYMDKLTQQRAALSQLLAEKQKLLETQEHLKRLRQNDAMTQTRHKPLETFIHNPTEASTSRQGATVDSTTQTLVSSEPRSDKYREPGTAASNTLLWRELRRQRELQEQKLKKRKERLLLERKGRRAGLENASEDEGFGRSTLSADITTATWGGSTQMSSTQNDSAVSEGSSHDSDEEILVEVEDDASDGIVQAEEEEEEEANSEVDIFPTTSMSNRKKFPKSGMKQNANQKRLLFEGLRKQDLERHERFKGWQNSLFPSGNKKSTKKLQRFSNPEELNEEERYSARERTMWERQFNVLQGQLENTTSLCNTLLRDQQTLISVLLNRNGETGRPSAFGPNSFSQYQQRQQEALQGIQNYFEQQRFLVQQQQMLQNLTECYSQMQQQHEDMLHLQQSFSQLFTQPTSEERTPNARPSATPNAPVSTLGNSCSPNSFSFQPSTSFGYRPQESVRETPPPSPFMSTQVKPSVERHVSTENSSRSQQPPQASFPWLPGVRNRQFQFVGSTNPDTGVPSPEASTSQAYNQAAGLVKPVSARVVSATSTSGGSSSLAYNPVTYTDPKASGSSNVVVGKQFPTPLRATAAAQLAEQDRSKWRGMKRRREEDKVETDSISSHQSSLPGDSEKPGTESDAQSDYSLFEALRDSIYAEVATLISQNESRPHFLIELFRELQLLGSDYLRQRALYSLRDLVTRFLKDDPPGGTIESTMGAYAWMASGSEQTPSESAGFSETDQDQDKMKVPEISTQGVYDYVEAVDSGSSLSTPNSGNNEPFASEFLGETVIHLEKALKSVRERERRQSECSSNVGNEGATARVQGETSSAGDVASESSLPDIQYPKIDTQALDRQIKKIMAEVIPCLNDHMEDTCSVELLEYIRKMVMGMIQQKNEAKEFSRFFHKQLESILQDSLAKFIGKRMKDCGEDLLVDISEILFNELAFYKLMQELDGGAKAKFFNREQKYRKENAATRSTRNEEGNLEENSLNKAAEMKDDDDVVVEVVVENENAEDQEDEGSSSSSSEWQVVDETPEDKTQDMMSREQLEQDEETLGRDRDDAMAEEFDESRNQPEAPDTESSQCVKVVELSMSESRALASNGSDDDEESEVEIAGDGNGENAEGAVWNGSINGSQSTHHSMLPSQMAAADGAEAVAEEGQGTSDNNQSKQEEDQDDDLPTKFTGLTEADLQVKIAEEQSRNDGIRGIVVSMDNGDELAGDGNAIPEPEGSALVNGDTHEPNE